LATRTFFTEIQTKLASIQVKNPTPLPPKSNNLSQTSSNQNQVFKTINIWDDQIDDLIKSATGYEIQFPALFLELILGDAKMVLGDVTHYPDSKIFFHIFSFNLNQQDTGKMEQNLVIYDLRDTVKANILGQRFHGANGFMSCYDAMDYKHKNITKYLLGFNFNYSDAVGSIYDSDSVNGLTFKTNTNLTAIFSNFQSWISGLTYTQDVSVVIIATVIYVCIVTNSDLVFTLSKWSVVPFWISGTSYSVGNYVLDLGTVFKCLNANSDITFTPSNWTKIS